MRPHGFHGLPASYDDLDIQAEREGRAITRLRFMTSRSVYPEVAESAAGRILARQPRLHRFRAFTPNAPPIRVAIT